MFSIDIAQLKLILAYGYILAKEEKSFFCLHIFSLFNKCFQICKDIIQGFEKSHANKIFSNFLESGLYNMWDVENWEIFVFSQIWHNFLCVFVSAGNFCVNTFASLIPEIYSWIQIWGMYYTLRKTQIIYKRPLFKPY